MFFGGYSGIRRDPATGIFFLFLAAMGTSVHPSIMLYLAAFLLGRVELEQEHDPDMAAHWFSVYVQEQPSGPLVESARGRILEIRRAQDDPAQVQAAARDYLEHHPDGSRASLARGLLDPP